MSDTQTTQKYKPRPYFNVANASEAESDEQFDHKKNPNGSYGQGSAGSDTQTGNREDTSEDTTDYKKRWIDLKKHYDTEVHELRSENEQLKNNKEAFVPPKTKEDVEKFRQSNPEFYDVMLSVAHSQMNQYDDTAGSRLRQLEEKLAQSEQEKAFIAIEKAHPDYLTIVNDSKFLEWLDAQDNSIQSWIRSNSNNASLFIRAIDLYKLDAGITKQMPKRSDTNSRKSATETRNVDTHSAAQDVSVSGNSVNVGEHNKRIWSVEEIKRMSNTEFAKHESELDEAMAEGRVQ